MHIVRRIVAVSNVDLLCEVCPDRRCIWRPRAALVVAVLLLRPGSHDGECSPVAATSLSPPPPVAAAVYCSRSRPLQYRRRPL